MLRLAPLPLTLATLCANTTVCQPSQFTYVIILELPIYWLNWIKFSLWCGIFLSKINFLFVCPNMVFMPKFGRSSSEFCSKIRQILHQSVGKFLCEISANFSEKKCFCGNFPPFPHRPCTQIAVCMHPAQTNKDRANLSIPVDVVFEGAGAAPLPV